MDPLTAAGLASAIITFVEIGTKIVKRMKELSEVGAIPEVFRDIRTRLPLIISIVVSTRHRTRNLSPEDEGAFEEVVRQCFEQVSQLDEILKKVIASEGDSRLRKTVRAGISVLEEGRVHRIASSLKDNVQLLLFLNVTPAEKEKPKAERRPSEAPPPLNSAKGVFLVPFSRDERFVGRESSLHSIDFSFGTQNRVAISGIGGVGKSQIAIEYCYRYKESKSDSHVLWVYGGNIARFYQGYKRIAQLLEIPGWDDPEESILEIVSSWLSNTTSSYLLIIDNADNIEHWWPGKYKSGASLSDPSNNLSKYLPSRSDNGRVLITTRDNRVASKLTNQAKPIILQPMSHEEARLLFLSKLGGDDSSFDEAEVHELLEELDRLPLAMSQAAAFIEENGVQVADYTIAVKSDAAMAEEYLHEELDDSRRDEESVNSVFRTWKLSYDQIKQQKPRAADLLSLLAMLDRQSVPKSLLKVPEVTTSLGVLQSFNLVTARAGSQSLQIHRLVQRFVRLSLQRENATERWQETALACVSRDYPTEIGVAEWPICDALAPHVHVILDYNYRTTEARLDLAHLLCWAADFDIERGIYSQALQRAEKSHQIFRELVPERDERLAAATWLYGRLRYYQAQSPSDMDAAAELLEKALSISDNPSLNFAESAFELAHLYYDQCNGEKCLDMGRASFKCWEELGGPNSSRTLDNMHDYALELAMLGHETDGIAAWQEIVQRSPDSDASENTKTVYIYRSMAGIAEFTGDAAMAEVFYAKLTILCEAIYHSEHIHVFDYRLSHAEQIMLQGKLEETTALSKAILDSCNNNSEWRIRASCLQTIAACYKLRACYSKEQAYRLRIRELHKKHLGCDHKETIDAEEALVNCYLNRSRHLEAMDLLQNIISWRSTRLGPTHTDTVRAIECLGICHAHQGQDSEAEAAFLDAVGRQNNADARTLDNLQVSLWNQSKWEALESWSRRTCDLDDDEYQPRARWNLISALEQQGKMEEALEMRAGFLALQAPSGNPLERRRLPANPPARHVRRFGRVIHPRTWSA